MSGCVPGFRKAISNAVRHADAITVAVAVVVVDRPSGRLLNQGRGSWADVTWMPPTHLARGAEDADGRLCVQAAPKAQQLVTGALRL